MAGEHWYVALFVPFAIARMNHQRALLVGVNIRDGKPDKLRAAQTTRLLKFDQRLPVGRLKVAIVGCWSTRSRDGGMCALGERDFAGQRAIRKEQASTVYRVTEAELYR